MFCFCLFFWTAFKRDDFLFPPPLCSPRLCLSITDFHPDTWNPAWSVSTILTGLLSFMVEKGPTLGSIETSDYAVSEKRSRQGCNDVKISGLKVKWWIEISRGSWYQVKLWNLNKPALATCKITAHAINFVNASQDLRKTALGWHRLRAVKHLNMSCLYEVKLALVWQRSPRSQVKSHCQTDEY